MSCNEVFNFQLKTGGKWMSLSEGDRRQQWGSSSGLPCPALPGSPWACITESGTAPLTVASSSLLKETWAQQEKHALGTQPFTNLQYILDIATKCIQFWLKQKWRFSFPSVGFQYVASHWPYTLLPVLKHNVFLLKIGEMTRFTEESWQLLFSWPD